MRERIAALVREMEDAVAARLAAGEAEPGPVELAALVRERAGAISDGDVLAVLRALREDTVGAGPLEALLAEPGVTDVLVNGHSEVWVDRGAGLERADSPFSGEEAVRRLGARLAAAAGGRLDEAMPFANARLRRVDGSIVRLHAVLSPPAERGTCLSFRVLRQAQASLDELAAGGFLDEVALRALRGLVAARRSFLVVGGTGAGKTTLLSALLAEADARERIVCIEDTAELNPDHPHVVGLVTRRANVEGTGEITLAELVAQALRMRPDRIVVGEIRGAEIADLLAALNTGHEGGAGTLHANSPAEVPARVEALAALGGLGRDAAHGQFRAGVDAVIHVRRAAGGRRRLAAIGRVAEGPGGRAVVEPVWQEGQGALDGLAELVGER